VNSQDRQRAENGRWWHDSFRRSDGAARRGGSAPLVLAIIAAALGLTHLGRHVDRDRRPVVLGEAGTSVAMVSRYAAVRVWLPQTLADLGKRVAMEPAMETHEQLKRILDREHLRDAWYAVTVRELHDGGGFHDLTVIRQPYHDASFFRELPEILASAAGRPARDPSLDFSLAAICVLPAGAHQRAPRDVMDELLATIRK
jgi:hypothetical protein